MKRKIEFKWALLFVLMMLLWMVMERALGLHDEKIELHAIVTNFVAIPAILIYYLAIREKKRVDYNNQITYGQAFMSGLVITLIVTLISPLTQYATTVWISPNYFDNVIAYTVENNLMTESEAKQYFNLNSYLVQTVAFTPVMGIITTLIVSLFLYTKRKK